VRAAGLELSARQRDDPPTMPNCYVVISTNPRTRTEVINTIDDLAGQFGVAPGETPIYFDYVRWKAHAFLHLQDDAQVLSLIKKLKTTEGIRDFAVVDTRDDPVDPD
jgi:hypothetical protein